MTDEDTQEITQLARELFDLCDDLDPELRCNLAGLLAIGAADARVQDLLEAAVEIAQELAEADVALGEGVQQLEAESRAGFDELDAVEADPDAAAPADGTDEVLRASLVIAQDREEQTDRLLAEHEARVSDPEIVARMAALAAQALRLQGQLIAELRQS